MSPPEGKNQSPLCRKSHRFNPVAPPVRSPKKAVKQHRRPWRRREPRCFSHHSGTLSPSASASFFCLPSKVRNSAAPRCSAVATCRISKLRHPPVQVYCAESRSPMLTTSAQSTGTTGKNWRNRASRVRGWQPKAAKGRKSFRCPDAPASIRARGAGASLQR